MHPHLIMAAALAAALAPGLAFGQSSGTGSSTTANGSAGCSAIVQAAANAASARVAADDKDISQPQKVKSLTCLDNFFKGVGLNVITNLMDPTKLLQSVEGQICNALTSQWKNLVGNAQCGITLTGFDVGFFGGSGSGGSSLGSGLSCPKLSFGGGGPQIGSIGVGTGNSGQLGVSGSGRAPTGYTLPSTGGLW